MVIDIVNQDIIRKRQFFNTRDTRKLVYKNLEPAIEKSDDFKKMLVAEDPDDIAQYLVTGWDKIINMLAPTKRIQLKKNNEDIITKQAAELKGGMICQ